jgi:DNA-binding MarR family transcriptional regulator
MLTLAHLLRIPYQALVGELHERLAGEGYGDLRPVHSGLLAHLSDEGRRPTELAERAQLTKQMAGYLIDALEGRGYVERVPDPTDGRAKLVRLTARGQAAGQAARRIIMQIEEEWAAAAGRAEMAELRSRLEELIGVVGQEARGRGA